jgi:demethylmenaquinone methyltransferase/2-methoxy-6-polyprenyl-1,4-benzoquinol methylase
MGEGVNDPYRRIAKRYDTFVEPPNAVLRKVALEMTAPTNGMRVLEVGCGTGTNLELYHRAGCRVSGIDLSPSMLSVAREKLGDRAELRLGDAADMPYENGSFDLVTAFLTLHEMPLEVRTPALAEMARVAGPEGRLLLIDYHPGPIRFPKGWIFKTVIVALEIAAGREHYRNYRDFLARRGLPGLIQGETLRQVTTKTLSAGNILAMVLTRG